MFTSCIINTLVYYPGNIYAYLKQKRNHYLFQSGFLTIPINVHECSGNHPPILKIELLFSSTFISPEYWMVRPNSFRMQFILSRLRNNTQLLYVSNTIHPTAEIDSRVFLINSCVRNSIRNGYTGKSACNLITNWLVISYATRNISTWFGQDNLANAVTL